MSDFDAGTGEILSNEITMHGDLGALFDALSKVQGAIKGALKDSQNPHFKSKYADLESTWDACRAPLSLNNFAVVQSPFTEGTNIGMITVLGHKSGAYIKGRLVVAPTKFDAQGAGSVITYLRRYALAAMVGVAPTDDDGEAAVGRPSQPSRGVPTGRDQQGGNPAPAAAPGAAAAPAAGKGTEFKPPPGQDMDTNNARELFTKIRDAIGVAGSKGAEVLAQHKDDLAKVAAHSPTAAAELMILPKYNLLRGIVAVAPHEIALDNVWLDAGADGSLEAIKSGSPRIHKLLETQVAKRREMLRASATAPSTEETMP